MGVKAKCRVCGAEEDVEMFRLHHDFKQMVCSNCFTGKTKRLEEKKKEEAVQHADKPPKPAGWDKDDEYLEKVSRQRQSELQSQFSKIPGSGQVQCKCTHCKYLFKYDPVKKVPRTCPYCDFPVPILKGFGML